MLVFGELQTLAKQHGYAMARSRTHHPKCSFRKVNDTTISMMTCQEIADFLASLPPLNSGVLAAPPLPSQTPSENVVVLKDDDKNAVLDEQLPDWTDHTFIIIGEIDGLMMVQSRKDEQTVLTLEPNRFEPCTWA